MTFSSRFFLFSSQAHIFLETTNSKDAFLCAAVLGFGRCFSFQACLYRPKIHSNQNPSHSLNISSRCFTNTAASISRSAKFSRFFPASLPSTSTSYTQWDIHAFQHLFKSLQIKQPPNIQIQYTILAVILTHSQSREREIASYSLIDIHSTTYFSLDMILSALHFVHGNEYLHCKKNFFQASLNSFPN